MLVNPIITSKGLALLAKISTNTLTLTSMGIGDGEKKISENVERLESERIKREVEFVEKQDNTIVARTTITNENIMEGFYIKEAGVYALDPDEGEILYAYTTVNGTEADYFSPGTGTVILREIIQLIIGFGNASSVSLTIDPKSVFMTAEDYEKISDPTFEDYEGGTQLPTPSVALGGIISRGKIQNLFSNIKAFLKQTVTWDKVVYNFVTNVKGYAADARCVKDLREDLDEQNQEFENLNTSLANQIGTAQGSNINLQNGFNGGLLLKELQGKSVQNGTPTPETKADIVSVGDDGNVVVKVCGKNLFPKTTFGVKTLNGITFTPNSDGSITVNGTATAKADFAIFGSWGATVRLTILPKGSYTLKGTGNANVSFHIANVTTSLVSASSSNAQLNLTEHTGVTYTMLRVDSGTTVSNLTVYPQLELGTTSTTYEPYKEQLVTIPLTQPLRSVGSVYDRGGVKVNGAWGNERKFATITLNGTVNMELKSMGTDTIVFGLSDNSITSNSMSYNLLCTHFQPMSGAADVEHIRFNGNAIPQLQIWINKSRLATPDLTGFKTWLKANPTTVIYELTTPIFEPYSQSLQDALNKLQSNQGVTNMFTTDALQPIISVSYGKTDTSALSLYANNIYDNKIDKSKVTNSLAVTEEGFVADPRAIKTINDKVDVLNNNLLEKANKSDIPTSLPANGGNAATVGGFTVGTSVPANAKFTDTVYTHPATHPASMITGLPTSLPANGGNADTVDNIHISVVTSLPSSRDANTLYLVKG